MSKIKQTADPSLYSPLAWVVREERRGVYEVTNAVTGDVLWITAFPDGSYRAHNERTDATYEIDNMLGCSCPAWERLMRQGRLCCKHSAAVISCEGFIALSDREAAAAAKKAAWEAEREQRRQAIEASLAADPELVAKYASRRRTADAWVAAAEAVVEEMEVAA
jgi:hypothetical protein